MKPSQLVRVNFIGAMLFSLCINSAAVSEPLEEMLKRARNQFYVAIEDKEQIEPTIKLFEQIARVKPKYTGRAQVYIGVLVALKGKYAFSLTSSSSGQGTV